MTTQRIGTTFALTLTATTAVCTAGNASMSWSGARDVYKRQGVKYSPAFFSVFPPPAACQLQVDKFPAYFSCHIVGFGVSWMQDQKGGRTMMELYERIALARKQAGLSQEQLGEKLGVSRQAVSKWESGVSQS